MAAASVALLLCGDVAVTVIRVALRGDLAL